MTKVIQGMAALSELKLWGCFQFLWASIHSKELGPKGEALEEDFSPSKEGGSCWQCWQGGGRAAEAEGTWPEAASIKSLGAIRDSGKRQRKGTPFYCFAHCISKYY